MGLMTGMRTQMFKRWFGLGILLLGIALLASCGENREDDGLSVEDAGRNVEDDSQNVEDHSGNAEDDSGSVKDGALYAQYRDVSMDSSHLAASNGVADGTFGLHPMTKRA